MIDSRAREPEVLPADIDARAALIERNRATPEPAQQIAAFLDACAVLGHGTARGADLYSAFDAYADAQNWAPYLRPTLTAFGRDMAGRFGRRRDRHGVLYMGVALT